jgi:transcription elongation factor GreB
LKGASVGDVRTVRLPGGLCDWEVLSIAYPEMEGAA